MTAPADDLCRAVARRRLLFTVTPGRSGTRYLAWVLRGFRAVEAHHEPRPKFSDAFRAVMQFPGTAAEFWLTHKLPRIARGSRPIYAETSHLVGKGFLEALLHLGLRPELLHLHRPHRAVASSLLRLGTIPGRTYRGVRYYLAPSDPGLLTLPAERVGALHDYQLCYWYCLEMAARAAAYADRWARAGLAFHDLPLADLASRAGIEDLGRRLDLGPRRLVREIVTPWGEGRRHNQKDDRKGPLALTPADLDELEAEVRALVGLA